MIWDASACKRSVFSAVTSQHMSDDRKYVCVRRLRHAQDHCSTLIWSWEWEDGRQILTQETKKKKTQQSYPAPWPPSYSIWHKKISRKYVTKKKHNTLPTIFAVPLSLNQIVSASIATSGPSRLGFKGVVRIFQRGVVTLCHTQGTYQIGMSTSRPCFPKSEICFSDEQWAWGEGQAYKIAA